MRIEITDIPLNVFENAERHVDRHQKHNTTTLDQFRKDFEKAHGVKVVYDSTDGWYSALIFPNEEAYTMFLLKWS
jgi:hypothetical protein